MLFKGARQPKKICPLALSSVICLSMAPVFLVIAMILDDGLNEYAISGFLFKYCLPASVFLSPVLALISFYRIVFRKIQFAGLWFSIAVIGLFTLEILVPLAIKQYKRDNPPSGLVCANHMRILFKTMRMYPDMNGTSLTTSKWCDLLHVEMDVDKKMFVCPEDKEGPCSYALNEFVTLADYQLEDLVVLFESRAGWNQVGGPELFNTDNHDGAGGRVVFADGSIRLVKPEEIRQLQWKP